MEHRRLGGGELRVAPISLGAMSFGSGFTRETVIDEDLAARLVHRALDAGVNLIDTADTYGERYGGSETVLGRLLRDRRDEVVLATKVGFGDLGPEALTPAKVIATCEGSLQRLGVEHIDLYQLHRADRTVPLEETLGAMETLVARGLVREIGVSNHHAWEIAGAQARQRALGRPTISSTQVYYSLAARDLEHEILPYCRVEGMGILVFSPLSGGQLSGWADSPGARGRRRAGALPPVAEGTLQAARAALDAVASARGVTLAQVALAWVLAQTGVTSVIVGPSTLEQLDDNLRAAELVLDPDELRALDTATRPEPVYPATIDESIELRQAGR